MHQHRPAGPSPEPDDHVETSADRACTDTLMVHDEHFEPYACEKSSRNAVSFWPAVTHTFIAAASPTLMNVPCTFGQVGYAVGFLGSFAIVFFYANCMHTLLAAEYTLCKRLRRPNLTYAEVMFHAFANGPRRFRWFASSARLLVHADFLCIWGGSNVINALLACENLKSIYEGFFGADIDIRQLMLYISAPLIALCWIPNLKLLAVCSAVANALNLSCIIIILCVSLADFPISLIDGRRAFGDGARIPLFLGVILITMNATGIIIPLKNEMKKPALMSARLGVLNVAYVPTAFLYALFGLLCYVKFGDHVKDNVILNLADSRLGLTVVGLFTASIIATYPLVSYVAFDTVWNNILKEEVRRDRAYAFKKYSCRTLVAASSIALAYVVPDTAVFVSLAGNVGVSLDSIIFPAFAEILVDGADTNGKRNVAKLCKNIVFILLGLTLCVISLTDSLVKLFRHCVV